MKTKEEKAADAAWFQYQKELKALLRKYGDKPGVALPDDYYTEKAALEVNSEYLNKYARQ